MRSTYIYDEDKKGCTKNSDAETHRKWATGIAIRGWESVKYVG
jgi:hypothetical protein